MDFSAMSRAQFVCELFDRRGGDAGASACRSIGSQFYITLTLTVYLKQRDLSETKRISIVSEQ